VTPPLPGLTDTVTQRLRDAILSGRLRDGVRLVERDIAAAFEVSRGPVRDALRQLAVEGLVMFESGSGARVASLTLLDGEEIMAIREAVEPLAVAYLVRDAGARRFDVLHDILGKLREACDTGNWPQIVLQDFALHRQLYVLCGRRRLLHIWESISEPLLHIFRINLGLYEKVEQVYANHERLVADIESGDVTRAEAAISEHITLFRPQLLTARPRPRGRGRA
jgi:DNA-binding GntR family transcriptional regulator